MRRGGYREMEGVRRRAQAGANAWRAYGNNNWVRNIAILTRRAAELREEGRMTRWRPMLRWEACKLGEM